MRESRSAVYRLLTPLKATSRVRISLRRWTATSCLRAFSLDLEGTDILEALDGDFLPAGLFLVEVNRLHDAAVDAIDASHGCQGEEDLDDDFDKLVHYFSVL